MMRAMRSPVHPVISNCGGTLMTEDAERPKSSSAGTVASASVRGSNPSSSQRLRSQAQWNQAQGLKMM